MAQDRVSGFIGLEVTNDGDTIGGTLLVIGSLDQQKDPNTGAFTPDWAVVASQPIIYPNFTSALKGGVITGSNNFRNLNVWFNGSKVVANGVVLTDYSNLWVMTTYNNSPALKRIKNITGPNDGTFELRWECEVYNGVNWVKVVRSTSSSLTTLSSSTYSVRLMADNGGIVDNNTSPVTNCILTPEVRLGSDKKTSGLFFKYFKMVNGAWVAFGSNTTSRASIKITPSDVDGVDAFMVEVYKNTATGDKIGSDVQSVIDNSDPFHVEMAQGRFSYGSAAQTLSPKIMQGTKDLTSTFTFTSLSLVNDAGDVLKAGNLTTKTIQVTFDDVKNQVRPAISINAER